jgi:hypothetical protein
MFMNGKRSAVQATITYFSEKAKWLISTLCQQYKSKESTVNYKIFV